MSLNQPTPPLLLTKRLTTFLNANLSPDLNAALLTTPSGKLLAHASSPASSPSSFNSSSPSTPSSSWNPSAPQQPTTATSTDPIPRSSSVALLRTQATVAASLYALHSSATPSISPALPGSNDEPSPNPALDQTQGHGSSSGSSNGTARDEAQQNKPLTITVQLSHGILVIRRLHCGLLFVCIGPLPSSPSDAQSQTTDPAGTTSQGTQSLQVPGTTTPRYYGGPASPSNMPASPSEADSVLSAGGVTTASVASSAAKSIGATAVVSTRRHAETLARWLDDKLGTLRVPEEGVGIGGD